MPRWGCADQETMEEMFLTSTSTRPFVSLTEEAGPGWDPLERSYYRFFAHLSPSRLLSSLLLSFLLSTISLSLSLSPFLLLLPVLPLPLSVRHTWLSTFLLTPSPPRPLTLQKGILTIAHTYVNRLAHLDQVLYL